LFLKRYCPVGARKAGIILTLLLVSSLGVCAQSTVVFQEDFENGLGGFVIDNAYGIGYGLWHLSNSCKVSLPGHTQGAALRYGQDDFCDYDIGRANRGVVESPSIDLTRYASGPIELRFKYYLEVEWNNCRWSGEADLATVEISSDGMSYVKIAKNIDFADPEVDCWEAGLVYLAPQTTNWTLYTIDLSDYAGSSIRLRFGFNTADNSQNRYDGFFVDDIIIYGPACNYTIAGDTNHDCVVNMVDFATMVDLVAMAENWLLNCHLTPSDPGCVPE
jgi:hypothetical protein